MEYSISKDTFNKNFLDKSGKFSHRTNIRYNLFPFTGSTSDKPLDSFDNILGAFLRNIYSLNPPDEINRESIISQICEAVDCDNNPANKDSLYEIIKDIYFADEKNLKCTSLNTYKYTKSSKNDHKISEYIVSALCDKEKIKSVLSKKSDLDGNLMDNLVETYLPQMKNRNDAQKYLALMPQISELFTRDLIFLINDSSSEFSDMIQLISYY